MSNTLKIFAISYEYPPMRCPQSIQISRILPNLKADVRVIHSSNAEFPLDETIGGRTGVTLDEVPYTLPFWKKAIREGCMRCGLQWPLRSPDYYITWFPSAYREAKRIIREFQPDVMLSFGMPMSDHILGLALKRKFGLPWVAHFSDPWVDNPFHTFTPVTKAINSFQERKVVEACDGVLFTSPDARDMVMKKYPSPWMMKAAFVPHAYDADRYENGGAARQGRVIRYLGGFYPPRTPQPLIDALRLILDSDPQALEGVSFEMVGPVAESIKGDYRNLGLPEGLLSFRDPVPYQESLSLMRDSDALLVIDAAEIPGVFFPSKLVDYIGADRPILGLCDPGGTSGRIIESVGGRCAKTFTAEDCARLLMDYLGTPDEWALNRDVASQYEVENVAARFLSELEKVAGVS